MNKIKNFLKNSEQYSIRLVCGLMLVIMAFCFIESFMHTMELRSSEEVYEGIIYHNDNFIINALLIVFLVIIISFTIKYLEKIPIWIQLLVLSVFVISAGTVWTFSSCITPSDDSYMVTNAAKLAANGDYSFVGENYFSTYSFQLGYVFFCEILVRIFGHGKENFIYMQITNVILLAASYVGLTAIMGKIFKSKRIQTLTVIMLFFCVQPVIYSTFIYGVIPGMTFAVYGLLFEIMFFQSDKKTKFLWALLSAACISVSIMIKLNNNIVLTAMIILAAVKTLRKFKPQNIIYIALTLLFSLSVNPAVKRMYESKGDVKLKSNVPIASYISMGLHYPENVAGCNAAGWYNGYYTCILLENNDWDAKLTSDISKQQIKEQLRYFYSHPREANDFFYEKIMSQWNEPTYSSIWFNTVKMHNEEQGKIAKYFCGDGSYKLAQYMNVFQMFVFFSSLAGIYICIKNKKDIFACSLPLIVLGGFIYHMLAEGKSQYILPYFIMLCAFSAYGLDFLCNHIYNKKELKIKQRK